ncbi:MAG: YHS domain-containing (seleno)protein [Bacteroidia bacterium]
MKFKFVVLLFLFISTGQIKAQSTPPNYIAKHILVSKNVAVSGYDVVAYYIQKKAVKGSETYSVTISGIKYYFSSLSNKNLFIKNPAYFLPQYGGWCAYAMGASGEKVEVDPETFKIINGKLYLFYNAFFNNTLKTWNKDEANLKAQADINWTKINK